MDKEELIFQEYKLYAEQKENFIKRNFSTNKFYMVAVFVVLITMIFTSNVVFMGKLSSTLLFALLGMFIAALWWMNVDSYNTLIKIKYSDVIEKIEESFPVKLFTEEAKSILAYKEKKVFMFSDIQKFVAVVCALFFFAIFVSELTPLLVSVLEKILNK